MKWPTDFPRHDGDIISIESLSETVYPKEFHAVVFPDGSYYSHESYDWFPWEESLDKRLVNREKPMPPLDWLKREYAGRRVVVVDAHN